MKKFILATATAISVAVLGLFLLGSAKMPFVKRNYIKEHGWLRVEGTHLVDQHGAMVQLKGLSSHGISWYPEFLGVESLKSTKAAGANLFRVAMYTDEGAGYAQDPQRNKELLYLGIDNALSLGMYAICDWHVLKDKTPMKHKKLAKDFFEEVSKKYKDQPGVIYEIVNEPNGDTSWDEIKAYAEEIIPIIRANSPNAVIIVGTPKHSANLDAVMESPLGFSNIMYSMHKYFDLTEYKPDSTRYLQKLIDHGLPIFVSEWGVEYGDLDDSQIDSHHDDRLDFKAAKEFAGFMKRHKISWCYWSLSDKAEAHSVILPNLNKLDGWTVNDFTPSGKLVFSLLGNE